MSDRRDKESQLERPFHALASCHSQAWGPQPRQIGGHLFRENSPQGFNEEPEQLVYFPLHSTVGLQQTSGCYTSSCICRIYASRVVLESVCALQPGLTDSHLTPAALGYSQVPSLELALAPGARMHSRFPGTSGPVALTIGEEARQVEDFPPQHIGPKGGGHRLMTHLQNQQRQKGHCKAAHSFLAPSPTRLVPSPREYQLVSLYQCLALGPTLAPI